MLAKIMTFDAWHFAKKKLRTNEQTKNSGYTR